MKLGDHLQQHKDSEEKCRDGMSPPTTKERKALILLRNAQGRGPHGHHHQFWQQKRGLRRDSSDTFQRDEIFRVG